ncbi:MAG TPA: serine hydrolase domain-containing protein [Conexibacter sp.]|jgi:D-alanyl-D-alanine carboxypeptidase
MFRCALLAGAAAVAGLIAPTAAGAAATSPAQADAALRGALRAVVTAPGGPPGAIAVVQRGSSRHVARAGVADLRTRNAWRIDDHMRLASTAKAFNGAVALSLVQQGRLGLDDTIGTWLPTLPAAWSTITLSELLHHTSGLANYTASPGFQRALGSNLRRRFTHMQLVGFVARDPLAFAPGSAYAYSNTDNIVAGLMTEAAARTPYAQLLRSEVYAPLGLHATTLPSGWRLPRPLARGYDFATSSAPPVDVSEVLSMSGVWAAGGIQSTPADVTRFVRGYVGGRLFGPAVAHAQRTWVRGNSDPQGPGVNSAGLSLFRYRVGCGTVYGHTGNIPGYTQFIAASSDGSRSITLSVNTQLSDGSGSPRAFHLLRRAFARGACAALAGG